MTRNQRMWDGGGMGGGGGGWGSNTGPWEEFRHLTSSLSRVEQTEGNKSLVQETKDYSSQNFW